MDRKKLSGRLIFAGVLIIVITLISLLIGPEANVYSYRLFHSEFYGLSVQVWLLFLGVALGILGTYIEQ
jgi:hypothetical protein